MLNIQNSNNKVLISIISFLKFAFYTSLIKNFRFKKTNRQLMADQVRLIRFNKDTDSVSLKIQELWSRVLDWLPEYKQVDRGPVMLYYSQFASGRRLFILWHMPADTIETGCNHQSTCMPQLQPLCSAALVPNVLPRRDEGSDKPCAVIEAL